MKRFLAVFLSVLFLAGGILPAQALTKEEQYYAALDTLSSYINSEMDDIDLCMLRDNFSALSFYRFSYCCLMYVNVLIEIEKKQTQEVSEEVNREFRIRSYFDTMRSDESFVEFLEEDEGFKSIDALENYYYGRQAEKNGKHYEAFNYYKNADSYRDSLIRMHALSNELYSDQYTQAVILYEQGKYEEAYKSFEEIYNLGYTQCEGMMMLTKQLWESTRPKEHVWLAATCTAPETCEICSLTRGNPLDHDWQEAACEKSRICKRCNADEGIAREHDWAPATCTSPRTCKLCYKTDGRALDHDWIDATCEKARFCSKCKITTGNPKGHDWSDATCEKESTCRNCGATRGSKAAHVWSDATCEMASTCYNCGATRGSKAAHVWSDATCEMASTCYNCGATRGSKAAHDWMSATCQRRQTCRNCGATTGSYGDHQWKSATYECPETCSVCGATRGTALVRSISQCPYISADVSDYFRGNNPPADAGSLIDDTLVNSWDSNGKNINEYFILRAGDGKKYEVTGLMIVNGKNDSKYFERNCRIKTLDVYVDGVKHCTISVRDIRENQQYIPFTRPATGTEFKFVIKDIYPGTKYKDVCVAEAGLY